jgi:hypothetical protein
MIAVIQCAARKLSTAGYMTTDNGTRVCFVAAPLRAPPAREYVFARPDDLAEDRKSWRELVVEYNKENRDDLGLVPAYRLYTAPVYTHLVDRLSVENVYILSAGWGLVRADYRLPYYDITFSPVKPPDAYKRRTQSDSFADFRLPDSVDDEIIFFGGGAYRPLFCTLTSAVTARRTVFTVAASPDSLPGCVVRRFETKRRTNWHYECAEAFLTKGYKGIGGVTA